ncbi:ATP-binding protein [Pedobacter sp. BS3]|uniref:AAA family ATPase n=1 Tax=Pedobacter sp. BS3 TaxID=2567937 RepID=UPI0011EE7F47|nr:ATP-binding protein [Pedobacter sp. BS3]TZF82044.1 ATP-binding protein [Pedobacter sp. BS3]
MDSQEVIKIAVVGPESTGKSTLSEQLAAHYRTVWVPEYSREYCSRLTGDCTWEDEINIFYGQLELEKRWLPRANKLLICDTTFITVKVWSEHVFGRAPQQVLDELPRHLYDLYLLMDIDLPWQDDPLRNFPGLRAHFMNVWESELRQLNASYQLISGLEEQRFQAAVQTIDRFLEQYDK